MSNSYERWVSFGFTIDGEQFKLTEACVEGQLDIIGPLCEYGQVSKSDQWKWEYGREAFESSGWDTDVILDYLNQHPVPSFD